MELHKATFLNRVAKKTAQPLSRLACSRVFCKPVRMSDAYLNFLMGKGSGTGWDLDHEIQLAVSLMYRQDPLVFDLGANVGEWTKGLLKAAPRARVFLFEPSPECQRQIRALQLPNATLVPSAAGERSGKAQLHFSSALDGSASLHPRSDSYFRDRKYSTLEVDVVTLDNIIEAHSLEFIDFLKMDVEGHELAVLKGAQQALKSNRVGALSFEFGSANINSRTFFRDFWTMLTSYGFRLWRISPGGSLLPIQDYYEDCEYFRGVSNYIAELQEHAMRSRPLRRAAL